MITRLVRTIGLFIAGVIVGVVFSRLYTNHTEFHIDRNIDLVGAVALGMTFVLATGFQRYFDRVRHSDELRKKALLNRLVMCERKVDAVEAQCAAEKSLYADLAAVASRCRREANVFRKYATSVGCKPVSKETDLLCEAVADLRTLATGNAKGLLDTVNDVTTIQPSRRVEIEKKCDEARQLIRNMEITIINDIS